MGMALESHGSSLRLRVDPQDHHHSHHGHHHQSHHHWWQWRHKNHSTDTEQPPRRVHHPHHHHVPAEPKPSTLSKRLSSATACHDDPHSAQGRRKRIVLHAIYKC